MSKHSPDLAEDFDHVEDVEVWSRLKSQLAAPPPVMSIKSHPLRLTDAALIVRAVPTVDDWISIRLIAEFAVIANAPVTVHVPDSVNACVFDAGPVTVQLLHAAVAATVTVAGRPEDASKMTLSVEMGADAPPAPPDDADQCVVSELFHVPAPPTQ